MRKYLLFYFLSVLALSTVAQHEAVSEPGTINIIKELGPPVLSIVEGSVVFEDANGNLMIDAEENCKIRMTVKNTGKGAGKNLSYNISATGAISGITFKNNQPIPPLKAGKSQIVVIPVTSYTNTDDGVVHFTIKINEPNGFGSEETHLSVPTRAFVAPMLQIVKFAVNSIASKGTNEKTYTFQLHVFLQNTGKSIAENVTIKINYPKMATLLGGSDSSFQFPLIAAGDEVQTMYEFLLHDDFRGEEIPFEFSVSEKSGNHSEKQKINVKLK